MMKQKYCRSEKRTPGQPNHPAWAASTYMETFESLLRVAIAKEMPRLWTGAALAQLGLPRLVTTASGEVERLNFELSSPR